MKRSTKLNLLAVVAFSVTVVLFSVGRPWPAVVAGVVGAVCAVAAGRAMQHEPRPRSRHDEDE